MFSGADFTLDDWMQQLLHRAQHSVDEDDRAEALALLRDTTESDPAGKLALGAVAFPLVCGFLREKEKDSQIFRCSIELVVVLLSSGRYSRDGDAEAHAVRINSELFVKDKGNIDLLLAILGDEAEYPESTYVRVQTLACLAALEKSSPWRLQEAVLGSHGGVSKLMDMLSGEEEVLRNEALGLLAALTANSSDVVQIVTFEGGFEKIFGIVAAEGGSRGGAVVNAALQLLYNLLQNNAANQALLKENGFLQRVPDLLQYDPDDRLYHNEVGVLCDNVVLVIATVATLLGEDASRLVFQNLLVAHGLLAKLLTVGVESIGVFPPSVRKYALHCIGLLLYDNFNNQEILGSLTVTIRGRSKRQASVEMPALSGVLNVFLTSTEEDGDAARAVAQMYFQGNGDGQILLASTFHLAADELWDDEGEGTSYGCFILRALLLSERAGARRNAAHALMDLLHANPAVKQLLMRISISPNPDGTDREQGLLLKAFNALPTAHSADAKGAIALLLLSWMHEFPDAVAALLSQASSIPTLVDEINANTDSLATGLMAAVVGACALGSDRTGGESGFTSSTIIKAVSSQVGLNPFFEAFTKLVDSPELKAANRAMDLRTRCGKAVDDSATPMPMCSQALAAYLVQLHESLKPLIIEQYTQKSRAVNVAPPELSGKIQADSGLQEYFAYLQQELGRVRDENNSLKDILKFGGESGLPSSSSPVGGLDRAAGNSDPHEASLLQAQVASLKSRLQQSEELANNAQNLATKYETDLADVSATYASLESHAFALESEIQQLKATPAPPPAPAAASGIGEAEVQAKIAAAIAEAREEMTAENDDAMNDLLVCLGQEERKVEALSEKLVGYGVDVEAILEELEEEEEEEEEHAGEGP